MPHSYSFSKARSRFAEVITAVEGGEDVEIVRGGTTVAVVVSPGRYARMTGKRMTFGDAYDAFMEGRDPKTFGFEPAEVEAAGDRAVGRAVDF